MPPRGTPSAREPAWLWWQAWAGVVPLAGYLVLHLLTQATALWGPLAHTRFEALGQGASWLLPLEVLLIYVPLVGYLVLGMARAARESGPAALGAGTLGGSAQAWRIVQQLSGAVLLVFIAVHVWELRVPAWRGELHASDYYPALCAQLSSTAWGGVPVAAIGYLLGVAAAALHGANGLYRAGLALGFVDPSRARLWARVCGALGFALFGLGALIVIDLATGSVLIHFSVS